MRGAAELGEEDVNEEHPDSAEEDEGLVSSEEEPDLET